MSAALNIIKTAMKEIGVEYGFGSYRKHPIKYPYFVGEYQETESFTEDGLQESTFLLTGFSRYSWDELEQAKEKIEAYFDRVGGKTVIAENNSAVAIFYASSLIVPTGDQELKSIQINLNVKEWKVN